MKKPENLTKKRVILLVISLLLIANTLALYTVVSANDAQKKYRPVIGGIEAEVYWNWFQNPECTLTFHAQNSQGAEGMVSAGHCADYTNGRSVRQPYGANNEIGVVNGYSEYSDSMFIDLNPGIHGAGKVLHLYNGYAQQLPVYNYISWNSMIAYWDAYSSYTVYKTGWRTGTTAGQLQAYYYVYYNGPGELLHMVYIATTYSYYGDSGAPVYFVYYDEPDGEGAPYARGVGMISGGLYSSPIVISTTSINYYNNVHFLDYWGYPWG